MAAILRADGKPPELVLLEIQSNVVMDDGSPVAGQEFGILQATEKGAVTLKNGPRTLHGKLEELKSPLVLMERTGNTEHFEGDPTRPTHVFQAHGVVKRKAVFKLRPQLSVGEALKGA
eukprot:gnl/TRDRNA2_/TRDRNA2_181534_c0_seq1.p1 gnl/TRDRNA2_/TRDRNA2_181534_c0~~gnl/TRDRNA2_/TRDRNA2_181534_c0_seq1.p1  ORF type:complete len:138 (-),score=22.04 gnl/TRDRNA2_/TRDRNA2_181534_c0_seq1:167-520(-)